MNKNAYKRCICCLKTEQNLYQLTNRTICDGVDINYETMLMLCTYVDINILQEPINYICRTCIESLRASYIFKAMCEESFDSLLEAEEINKEPIKIDSGTGEERETSNCELYEKSFIDDEKYMNHLLKHENPRKSAGKVHTCDKSIRGKEYNARALLHKHSSIKFKCKNQKSSQNCTQSGTRFMQTKHLMKEHPQSHLLVGVKALSCEICGRVYATKGALNKHFNKFCGQGIKLVYPLKKSEKRTVL